MQINKRLIWCVALAALVLVAGCKKDDDDNPGNGTDSYSHIDAVGESSEHFIRGNVFDRLEIEILHPASYEPTSEALAHLEQFCKDILDKPNGISVTTTQVNIAAQSPYTSSEVRDIEDEVRTLYTEGSTLRASLLVLDGEFDNEGEGTVLGIAYRNTSMAIFGASIESFTGGIGQPSRALLESTVIAHELGHLLGLVNNNLSMVTDHHDEENGAHCDNEDCLMYWSVETGGFTNNLIGMSNPPGLDQDCLNDIEAVK